ncbi:trypsin-like serine peptidase [Streptomyces sp. NPDC048639]|uniref:trypsin-like serine peptidase n=1 Tax=Streptomyces sp. NPDC048639 TaxID=3365581 RepID=UPI00371C4204
MPSIRPPVSRRSGRSALRVRGSAAAAVALTAVLAVTATACGASEDGASPNPGASATSRDRQDVSLPNFEERLRELGVDVDKWKNGEWKNWKRDDWLREAGDFVNPVIEDLWKPERMKEAEEPEKTVPADVSGDQGVTDPEPQPVQAKGVSTPYHDNAAPVGKVFFDGPQGSMVCSATVVKDPANPGKSNLVWTAGHCVHAGKSGGWYRNIAFVPSFNDNGVPAEGLKATPREEVAPYGVYWANWASTSQQWISEGTETGGNGAPYDYAVLHVKPEKGSGGKSLEETVGAALSVEFNAPAVKSIDSMGAWGYPAAPPYDGAKMFSCVDRPGRFSLASSQPTMYRIGCTMTGGASGGGWFANGTDGKPALVSNTSIGPRPAKWLAGPHLGPEAKKMFEAVSRKFAGQ